MNRISLCVVALGLAIAVSSVADAQVSQGKPIGRPVSPQPPGVPGAGRPNPPTPPQSGVRKNRLFPTQDLGLIEPADRDQWQSSDQIMDNLNIAEGAVVAELGAGGGWFTERLARRVGANGLVYAEDVQPTMLEGIRRRAQRENLGNVRTVLGTATDPKLPPGIDAVLIIGAYHEMACAERPSCQDPVQLLSNVAKSLKSQGRLGIVDFNPGDGGPGPSFDERVDPEAIINVAAAAGLRLIKREPVPPFNFQFLLVFGRAAARLP